jgi:hypothetical protein
MSLQVPLPAGCLSDRREGVRGGFFLATYDKTRPKHQLISIMIKNDQNAFRIALDNSRDYCVAFTIALVRRGHQNES